MNSESMSECAVLLKKLAEHDSDTVLCEGLGREQSELFQRSLSKPLAKFYLDFLAFSNGAQIGPYRLFSVGDSPKMIEIVQRNQDMAAYVPELKNGEVYGFGNDWGGSMLCFDLRDTKAAGDWPILIWNHEYSEEPEDAPNLWSKMAANFSEFLMTLVKDALEDS